MHDIEPFYGWRDYYLAENDKLSPFYECEYNEFEFTHQIYNYLIHPQWDFFGSATLFVKILYADYEKSFAILEFIGEWNDCLYNDIMYLKRNVIEQLIENGINRFILLGENILNFHYSEYDYYEEWSDDAGDGWIAALNFRKHVTEEFFKGQIDNFVAFGADFNNVNWRTHSPENLFYRVESLITKRLPSY
jgi:hypothetical protein